MKLPMLNILVERDVSLVLLIWCLFSSQSSLEAVLRCIRSLSKSHESCAQFVKISKSNGILSDGDCTYL